MSLARRAAISSSSSLAIEASEAGALAAVADGIRVIGRAPIVAAAQAGPPDFDQLPGSRS